MSRESISKLKSQRAADGGNAVRKLGRNGPVSAA